MENKTLSYKSKTYNVWRAFLFGILIFVLVVISIIIVGRLIDNFLFVLLGWIGICTVPFLFQKQYKNIFTRKVSLEFDNKCFLVNEYRQDDDVLLKQISVNWSDIKSYKCYFTQSNITYVVMYLRNGSSNTFSFSDEKNQEEAIESKSVFSIFHYFITQYNLDKKKDEMITFRPGFFTTKLGGIVLLSLTSIIILFIIIHFIVDSKTAKFSFMSVFILLGLLAKREGDKKFYNKINQLDPRSPFNDGE